MFSNTVFISIRQHRMTTTVVNSFWTAIIHFAGTKWFILSCNFGFIISICSLFSYKHTHLYTWMKSRYFAAQIFFCLKFKPPTKKLTVDILRKNSKIYQKHNFSLAYISARVYVLISLSMTCIYTALHIKIFALANDIKRDKTIYSFACFVCRMS